MYYKIGYKILLRFKWIPEVKGTRTEHLSNRLESVISKPGPNVSN